MKFTMKPILLVALVLIVSIVLAFLLLSSEDSKKWAPVWKSASSLSVNRQGLAAVEVNGFIYAMGGAMGTNFLKTTEYAKVLEDGSLGPWMPGPPMNEARGYVAAVAKDGYIYVIGGGHGEAGKVLLRTVERSRVLPDGSLSPWEIEKNSMVFPRRCAKAVLVDDTIYAIGGFSGDMLNNVEHSRINADGTIGMWFVEPEKLTEMSYISGVKNVDGIVYVAGSHEQRAGRATRNVEWSMVVDEAGFGKWQKTTPMQVERFGQGLIARNGRLYAIGGLNGPSFIDSIESAPILSEGGVEQWTLSTSKLSSPRAMMAILIYKDRVYSIGGAGTNVVEYATFNEDGAIGSWLTPEELETIETAKRKQAEQASELPNAGLVLKTMHADPYVYLQVQVGPQTVVWVAAPAGDYKADDKIRFGGGAMMTNFFSKQLNKRFEEVFFVQKVRKVE
ncbi:MAG: hypothetical protein AMK71_07950 [Nitrospira bacterium SG8_35_4]|nr:MAG: hypothetical protein AMK71_07950 [Nitrospira bacterium SG8_35_4]